MLFEVMEPTLVPHVLDADGTHSLALSFFIDKPGEGKAFKAVRHLHCFDAAGMAWYGGRQLEATAQSCWIAPPWAHGAVPERGVDDSLLGLSLGQWRLEHAAVSFILSNYDATNAFACSSRADLKTAASTRLLPGDVPFFMITMTARLSPCVPNQES